MTQFCFSAIERRELTKLRIKRLAIPGIDHSQSLGGPGRMCLASFVIFSRTLFLATFDCQISNCAFRQLRSIALQFLFSRRNVQTVQWCFCLIIFSTHGSSSMFIRTDHPLELRTNSVNKKAFHLLEFL